MKNFPQKTKTNSLSLDRAIGLLSLLLIIGITLAVLMRVNLLLKEDLKKKQLISTQFLNVNPNRYPILKSIAGQGVYDAVSSNISAHGAIIMDDATKVIVFSKNEDLRFSLASTTKIMTALVVLEHYSLNDVITIKTDAKDIEGQVIGFKKGEQFTVEDLLYALLLPSSNDAAFALAQNYEGGEGAFVERMNKKVKEFYLEGTHFQDPAGLLDDSDYTTVLDLARLSSISLKNKTFAKIVNTQKKVILDASGKNSYTLYNLNKLLSLNGVDGVKTGFTDQAGGVLVTSTHLGDFPDRFIIVVMKSLDRFADTVSLLNFLSQNLTYKKF